MKDWIIHFVKTKDVFLKQLKNYEIKEDTIEFTFENYKHYYLFKKELNNEIMSKAEKFEKKTIVCEKNQQNFDYLINNFENLSKIDNLVIIFLSPDKQRKLLINPKVHSKVSDPDTLNIGLQSLWDNS